MTLERLTPGAEVNLNRGQTVVVMPVFGGYEFVAESLAAALRHTASDVPLCVINDGSDDDRIGTLVEDLGAAGQPRRLFYIEHESNLGFVESCNEAFERFAPADVVILNSDCVVAEQWLERMQAAAASDARIATVSALSNSGSIISIPERNEPTEGLPAGLSLEAAAERVADVSAQARPPLPAAIGHCMLIRRMALELVGGFDPVFSPGYGEEVDFSARCTAHGLAHVLADDVFVLHHGGASFDRRTDELTELHNDIVFGRYPWLDQSVSEMAGASEGPLDGALMRASLSQRRLRVTVDGSCLAAAWTGTQVHTLGVIAALASNSDVELRVLVSPNLSPETRALIAAQGPSELLSTEDVDHRTRKSDIVHRPFQSGSPSDFEYLSRLGRRIVVSQLDQIHFHNPSYSIEAEQWLDYRATTAMLGNVDLALFISNHAAEDAIANSLVEPDRAAVIHLGVDRLAGVKEAEPTAPEQTAGRIGSPFLFCLGTDFSHKNRVFAIRLLGALRARGWDGQLVFAGPKALAGNSAEEERAALDANPALKAHVLDVGPVDEGEKRWLFERSAATVYPTTYEGFGLVPFEAADAGAPCIFASNTSLAELFPVDLASIVPWNADASAERVMPLLTDPEARAANVAAINEVASGLTWQRYGEQLEKEYRRVVQRERRAATAPTLIGRGNISREAYWLVGPDGMLDERYQRPLLAIASRPGLAAVLLEPIRWLYLISNRLRLLMGRGESK